MHAVEVVTVLEERSVGARGLLACVIVDISVSGARLGVPVVGARLDVLAVAAMSINNQFRL